MIKVAISALILIGSNLVLHTVVKANGVLGDDYYCYIEDSRGMVHDLTEMCSRNRPEVNAPSSAPALTGAALEEALSTGVFIYADTFCEARAQGGTRRQANDAAGTAASSFMASAGISADDIDPDFISMANETSSRLCPDLQPTGIYD